MAGIQQARIWLSQRIMGRAIPSTSDRSPIHYLIVGLGNPGRGYARNRHNVGFMVVERFADKHGLRFSRRQGNAEIASGDIAGTRVLIAKPQTFMNLSGGSVSFLTGFYKVSPSDCLVVCDDLDLPVGKLRIREQGGSGGHNGLKSIADRLGTTKFPRFRIGIGRPQGELGAGQRDERVTNHVLGDFTSEERGIVEEAIDQALAALEVAVVDGVQAAMTRFNT